MEPELDRAKKDLAAALSEACKVDVKRANTGELIRVEEVLAIANEAAKTAVSLRRRQSPHLNEVSGDDDDPSAEPALADTEQDLPIGATADVDSPAGHRVFVDSSGMRWDAFAVHPGADVEGRSRLPEPYRSGWLAFECEREKRRLSPIPEGWRSLSYEELVELCERAERVRRRTRAGERPSADG